MIGGVNEIGAEHELARNVAASDRRVLAKPRDVARVPFGGRKRRELFDQPPARAV
jgi:hypothetical protein